ncbi:MAG: group I intron-associated PD-(D/E)XK endonuclease [Promethearchaeota archaeon]|jgi:hypothetical protein
MPHKLRYDWEKIQKFYNAGHSIRECHEEFGFGNTSRIKAIKAGRFTPRSHEEACNLLRKNPKPQPTGHSFSPTSLKGEIACSKFECRALEKEIIISKPNLDCSYDRIVDIDGKLFKVQVKYAGQERKGCVIANVTKTCRKREQKVAYEIDEIDVIVVYIPMWDKVLWLPQEAWAKKKAVALRTELTKNGQSKYCLFAKDYIW